MKLYIGNRGRRVHHYEVGLYFIALGLGLLLEDLKDRKLIQEYLEIVEDRIQEQAEKRRRRALHVRWN